MEQICLGRPDRPWIWHPQHRVSPSSKERQLELRHVTCPPTRGLLNLETGWLRGAEGWVAMSEGKNPPFSDTPRKCCYDVKVPNQSSCGNLVPIVRY
jgi:hypothetical protein